MLEIKDASRDKLSMTAIKGDTGESEILMGKGKVAVPLLLSLFLFSFVNFVKCKMNFYADDDFEVNSALLLSIIDRLLQAIIYLLIFFFFRKAEINIFCLLLALTLCSFNHLVSNQLLRWLFPFHRFDSFKAFTLCL